MADLYAEGGSMLGPVAGLCWSSSNCLWGSCGMGMPAASSMRTSDLSMPAVSSAAPTAAWPPSPHPSSPPRSSSSFSSSGPRESWSGSPISCSLKDKGSIIAVSRWGPDPIADEIWPLLYCPRVSMHTLTRVRWFVK